MTRPECGSSAKLIPTKVSCIVITVVYKRNMRIGYIAVFQVGRKIKTRLLDIEFSSSGQGYLIIRGGEEIFSLEINSKTHRQRNVRFAGKAVIVENIE